MGSWGRHGYMHSCSYSKNPTSLWHRSPYDIYVMRNNDYNFWKQKVYGSQVSLITMTCALLIPGVSRTPIVHIWIAAPGGRDKSNHQYGQLHVSLRNYQQKSWFSFPELTSNPGNNGSPNLMTNHAFSMCQTYVVTIELPMNHHRKKIFFQTYI